MKVTRPRQARRPLVSLAPPGQLASPPRQQRPRPRPEKRWKVIKVQGIKVVLRSCTSRRAAPPISLPLEATHPAPQQTPPETTHQAPPEETHQAPPEETHQAPPEETHQVSPPAKEQTAAPSVPALAHLPEGLTVRRREEEEEEEFEDPLADAMGFGGPPPPMSYNYYDLPGVPIYASMDDDAARAALLGFPVPLGMENGPVTHPQPRTPDPADWNEDDPTPDFHQVMDAPDLSTIFETEPQLERCTSFFDTSSWHPRDYLLTGTLWDEPCLP